MAIRKFYLKNEEMPVVGSFLLKSFETDMAHFQAYSPDFNPAYKAAYQAKLLEVDNIVNPRKILAELKKITDILYTDAENLRNHLQLLEGYVKRAEDLTIMPKDFGITALRKNLSRKNIEGVIEDLKVLFQNIDDNLPALQAKGFTNQAYDKLKALRDNIKLQNQKQNEKISQKQSLVDENIETLNQLWDMMSNIMDAGKRIARTNPKVQPDNYTKTKLQKRVNREITQSRLTQ